MKYNESSLQGSVIYLIVGGFIWPFKCITLIKSEIFAINIAVLSVLCVNLSWAISEMICLEFRN